MVRLSLISDLHLEFRWPGQEHTWSQLQHKINSSQADLVINCGDIHPNLKTRDSFHEGIKLPYVHILGNHDFYGHQPIRHSRFVKNINGIVIAGCTLWTDFCKHDPLTMFKFKVTLADGYQIEKDAAHTTLADEIYDIHKKDLEFLRDTKPDVVVTHHAPSFQSVAPIFRDTGHINYYFMSDLDDFILNNPNIKLWCSGHTHSRYIYKIGNCVCVNNSLGYPREQFQSIKDFDLMILDLDDLPNIGTETRWLKPTENI